MTKIEIKCKGSGECSLDDLEIIQGNFKELSEHNFDKLKNQIITEGFISPFHVWINDGKHMLIDGTQRYRVLTKIKEDGGIEMPDKWPMVSVEAKSKKEAAKRVFAISSQYGTITSQGIYEFMNEVGLNFDDIKQFQYDKIDWFKFKNEFFQDPDTSAEDDNVPAVKENPVSKPGDIWVLGNHRVMCGDSTSMTDVEKLMKSQKADLLLTDPPYNVDYEGKTKDKLTIQNDKMNDDDFRQFLRDAFSCADAFMKAGASFYIWHSDTEGYNFRGACLDTNWEIRQCLIWKKNKLVMGRQDYHWIHEPCLYGWKKGSSHTWYSDRKQTTVLEFDKPSVNDLHPTMKPVHLMEYQVKNNSKEEDIILDLFLGSGSTLIACHKTKRICYGMELDPKYCDVIVQRWQEYTEEDAILESSGETYNELIA